MRTLIGTLLVGTTLVGGPAMAQQHPWVPSGEPVYSQPNPAAAVQHPWVPSAYAGTASLPNSDLTAQAQGRVRADTGSKYQVRQSGN